mmetsp:Transcript_15860/g.40782  ORF Transcript_15860/g.40782 Transcript_15860/m.40782 type:complete len:104 (-) Transcript_15860:227-538(-)
MEEVAAVVPVENRRLLRVSNERSKDGGGGGHLRPEDKLMLAAALSGENITRCAGLSAKETPRRAVRRLWDSPRPTEDFDLMSTGNVGAVLLKVKVSLRPRCWG